MWRNAFVTLVFGLIFLTSGDLADNYISCGEITQYCSAHGTSFKTGPSVRPPQGLPRTGKAGPKGEKGDIGPRGPPAEFDYDGFEARILKKVKEMITNCRLSFKNSCFFLVGDSGTRYNKEQLESKCADGGGRLANLYSDEHRLIVAGYIREQLGVYAQITLGMSYNVEEKQFRFTSGETANIKFTWHPSYPLQDGKKNHMFFSVQPDPASKTQGTFNYFPSHTERYGLCEYEL